MTTLSITLKTDEKKNDTRCFGDLDVDGWKIFKQRYQLANKVIGRGAMSIVYLARHRVSHKICAVKFVDKSRIKNPKQLVSEVKILKKVEHPRIIKLEKVYETKSELILVMEYVEGGELFDRLVSGHKYSETESRTICKQLFNAVSYLHERGIIHRDIKPENILLASKASHTDIKISDFGLAKVFTVTKAGGLKTKRGDSLSSHDRLLSTASIPELTQTYSSPHAKSIEEKIFPPKLSLTQQRRPRTFTACGSESYMAPEIFAQHGYGVQVDIWSIGIVLYVLLSGGNYPTHIHSEDHILKDPYLKHVSYAGRDILSKMLVSDPEKRVTAEDALQHFWFSETLDLNGSSISIEEKLRAMSIESTDD